MGTERLDTPQALRAALSADLRRGCAVWLRLRGIGLDDAGVHGSLLTTLVRSGFGNHDSTPPETVVLDWSTAETFGADGIAFFSVVSRRFAQMGSTVLACDAQSAALARVLTESGVRESSNIARWVPATPVGQITVRNVAQAAIFGPGRTASVEVFMDGISAAVRMNGFAKRAGSVVVGATNEIIQNVLSHGEAQNAAATALMFVRRRPRILQIALADDGIGIPASLVAQPRHAWVTEYSDALATQAALRDALSGRAEDAPGAFTGGGMARIVRRLVTQHGATITVRSGAALVRFSPSRSSADIRRLTYGHGTQIRVDIPIP